MGIYDRYLALRSRLHEGSPPRHVCLVLTERDLLERGAYDTLEAALKWAFEFEAQRVTVYVSVLDPAASKTLATQLRAIDAPRPMAIREPDDSDQVTEPIQISIGLGGKREFVRAIQAIATDAAASPTKTEVTSTDIENRLVFPDEPDLVIKTGAERLSDFMIWQSVYSELYFTDVNWRDFRRRDYLRAVLDFKRRQRRFGH